MSKLHKITFTGYGGTEFTFKNTRVVYDNKEDTLTFSFRPKKELDIVEFEILLRENISNKLYVKDEHTNSDTLYQGYSKIKLVWQEIDEYKTQTAFVCLKKPKSI